MPSLPPPHPDLYRRADRLLVLMPWSIRDVLAQRSLLAALRRAAPAAEILGVGAAPAAGLLDDGRVIDTIATYQHFGLTEEQQEPSAEVDESLRAWLDRAGRADFVFIAPQCPAAALHALEHAGIPTIAPDRDSAAEAYARSGDASAAWLAGAAAGWGLPIEPQMVMRLDPPDWARRAADEFFEEHQIADWLPAAIAPGPTGWPPERYAEIGDRLIASTRSPLLLLSSAPDSAEATISRMERQTDVILVEQRHLLKLAAMLQRSRVLVCGDPGLFFMGATVGTPSLGISAEGGRMDRPRFPWAATIAERADVDDVWEALRALIPLTASPTGVHPTHTAIAGAGAPRTGRPQAASDEER
jgi:ADP-heptose:LPS heptosyltransferase